jgi:hypothetical protein
MEIKLGDRTTTPKENEEKRRLIVENYKEFMPDIENVIYGRRNENKVPDYSFLYRDFKNVIVQQKFNDLANVIVDIRNNTKPTTYYSNSISKSDNRLSNETKRMVKHLLAKGWSETEVAYEIEKIFGSGTVTYYGPLTNETKFSFTKVSLTILNLFLVYKIGKFIKIKYMKKLN